ncbi:MAG: ExbD/TolR family protein [Crocinitomicaceae bacterium]
MSKFRKKGKKGQPPVNTAALPDIVFMLLFFFMVATRPKEKEPKLELEIPESVVAIELNKDDENDYIWAGYPLDGGSNALVEVFLDDQFEVDYMSKIAAWKLGNTPPDMKTVDVITILKIDDDVNMKTVANIKDALSDPKVGGYRIVYSTKNKLGE